jgi:ubiquinone/menaquinone biosynthesis C-methylase UbiE
MTHIDYNQLAAEYAQHRQVHPGVLEALCQDLTPASAVLEVGCGTGNYTHAIASLVGCTCWGIDPSVEMLAQARPRSSPPSVLPGREDRPAPAIRYQVGRAESLGVPAATFDRVYSVDVIHHVDDPAAYYTEAFRALCPGGHMCTATDSEWIIRHREPLATYYPETIPIELERYPRIGALRTLMERAGLEQIAERTVAHAYAFTDLQAYRDKAFSVLHVIPEQAYQRGMRRMEEDLCAGPIEGISRYVLLWGMRPLGT